MNEDIILIQTIKLEVDHESGDLPFAVAWDLTYLELDEEASLDLRKEVGVLGVPIGWVVVDHEQPFVVGYSSFLANH